MVRAEDEAGAGSVPDAFVARETKVVRVVLRALGIVAMVLSAALEMLLVMDALFGKEYSDGFVRTFCALVFATCLLFGVVLFRLARRRITVRGSVLHAMPAFGKERTFCTADIERMQISANGIKLIGREGETLVRFEDNQENSTWLLEYLKKHKISLMAEDKKGITL